MDTRTAGKPFPWAPVVVGAGLLLVTLAVTDFGNLILNPGTNPKTGTAILSRSITFEDRADGGVIVRNAESGALVLALEPTAEPTSNGFLRGSVRALTRERKKDQIGRSTPFRLIAWDDGRLTLEDPATNQRIALEAFGDTQKAVFMQILEAAR
jgi:putative photosynthetic complex assembly protein